MGDYNAARMRMHIANDTQISVVYNLGCGDGRTVMMAARVYKARSVGI